MRVARRGPRHRFVPGTDPVSNVFSVAVSNDFSVADVGELLADRRVTVSGVHRPGGLEIVYHRGWHADLQLPGEVDHQ